MAAINTRVATAGGSLIRGVEVKVAEGQFASSAANLLIHHIGGQHKLTQLQERFEFRLVSRGTGQFLQLREKTLFGQLKALFSGSHRARQDTERRAALDALQGMNVVGAGAQTALMGGQRQMSAPSPRALPIAQASAMPGLQPLVRPTAMRAPASAAVVPSQHQAPAPAPAPSSAASRKANPAQGVEAPPAPPRKHKVILDAEARVANRSALDMARSLNTRFLLQALSDGEISLKTYEAVITERHQQGRLDRGEYRMLMDNDPKLLPDQSQVSVERQRAMCVREEVQAKLVEHLKPKYLFSKMLSGEITERAYHRALQEQRKKGTLDAVNFDRWDAARQSPSAAKMAREIDLSLQVNMFKMEQLQKSIYADQPLDELWKRKEQGAISDSVFEGILKGQKKDGLITPAQLALWSERLNEIPSPPKGPVVPP